MKAFERMLLAGSENVDRVGKRVWELCKKDDEGAEKRQGVQKEEL